MHTLFLNELRSFLNKVGYTSKDIPEPAQLQRIRLFSAVDWSNEETCTALYDQLDLLIRKYTGMPELKSYIEALCRIRSDMEKRLSSQTKTPVPEPVHPGE